MEWCAAVSYVLTPFRVYIYPEDGGSVLLWTTGNHLPDCSQCRKPQYHGDYLSAAAKSAGTVWVRFPTQPSVDMGFHWNLMAPLAISACAPMTSQPTNTRLVRPPTNAPWNISTTQNKIKQLIRHCVTGKDCEPVLSIPHSHNIFPLKICLTI